jgi:hypothetical protein
MKTDIEVVGENRAMRGEAMPSRYAAKISVIPDEGIRFEPEEESAVPSEVNATHLLVLGIALALGRVRPSPYAAGS